MSNHQFRLSAVVLGILLVAASTVETGSALAANSDGTTVVFLVRHAEKAHDDDPDNARGPDLPETGRRRAEALARVLASAGVTRIHSTDYRRTLETARPFAEARGLEIETYDARDPADLVTQLRQSPGRHLVVGHSNTTPELVELLGGELGTPIDEGSEYDRLYVLFLGPHGSTATILQRYGSPSAP